MALELTVFELRDENNENLKVHVDIQTIFLPTLLNENR